MGRGALGPIALFQRADIFRLQSHALIQDDKFVLGFCCSIYAGYKIENGDIWQGKEYTEKSCWSGQIAFWFEPVKYRKKSKNTNEREQAYQDYMDGLWSLLLPESALKLIITFSFDTPSFILKLFD